VCCSVLQYVAVCCSLLQCVAVCCSIWQCFAVCCGNQEGAQVILEKKNFFVFHNVSFSILEAVMNDALFILLKFVISKDLCVAECCRLLQCVAVCCSVLQCVAVRCSAL